MTYLRCTIGRWNIDLDSGEAREALRLKEEQRLRWNMGEDALRPTSAGAGAP
jgi:hypothetical protein